MYAIKQIDPTDWQSVSTLAQFYADLATKPYCTNSKGFSHIRTKSHAIKHAYIQPNHPEIIKWLVFDIDDPQALFAYHDNDLPPPQIIIKNPENGHAHYAYRLTKPVDKWRKASTKPVEYLASVQKALRLALGADKGYSGNLIKNPCHNSHEVYITGAKPSYTLAELADYLDLKPYQQQEPANDEGYGRNVNVFNHVRHQAYPIAQGLTLRELERVLTAIAEEFNQRFDVPLFPNELKYIVRSITRYCKSGRFGAYSEKSKARFSRIQSCRVKRANRKGACNKGGQARSAKYEDKRKQAQEMHEQGINNTKIALNLGLSRKTIVTWIKLTTAKD